MTDQPLTDQQLDDIDARAKAATPGPWGVYEYGGGTKLDIAADLQDTGCGYRARREIASLEDEPLDNDPTHREWTAEEDWAQVQADAAFVAAARTDVPALVDEIRRLRDQMAAVTELLDQQELAARAFDVPLPEWITAVRHAIEHKPVAEETHVVADDSDDPEHVDDCPGCEAFTLPGHVAAPAAAGVAGDSGTNQ